ncbi:hypothetical protein [Streptomyces sp. bgisy153]|uniref:hypothetical protein n=1 Tax=Streptomyces sp. bgisy153 TaxID=3413793 RepID=UPI003D7098D9
MGCASAGGIFDPVAEAMQRTGASDEQKTEVLSVLIKALHDGDWDTDGESLGAFQDDPAIVEAFRRNGVVVPCGDERSGLHDYSWCGLERDHAGPHQDWRGNRW